MTKQVICISVDVSALAEADRAAQALGYTRSRFFEMCVLRILKIPEFEKAVKKIESIQVNELLKEEEAKKA